MSYILNANKRVAWLLNHNTLHDFEVPLIRSLGLEVYTCKRLPLGEQLVKDFGVASPDYSDDFYSTLPEVVMMRLNQHNFYEDEINDEISHYLNEYFGSIIVGTFPAAILRLCNTYKGKIIIRAFGRESPYSYEQLFKMEANGLLWDVLKSNRERVWFAPCYPSIVDFEQDVLREKSIILPLGIPIDTWKNANGWLGIDQKILFVCPRIMSHPFYYGKIYEEFKLHFGDIAHVIAGGQPIKVEDPCVSGYVSSEIFQSFFIKLKVMFYHSQEPRHLHYHPLEAIVYGMPVIFMRGGLLEEFGGEGQPGACSNHAEAREKIQKILNNDTVLINLIKEKQKVILHKFCWRYNHGEWRSKFLNYILGSP